jgi:anti-anti-sigma regulatory factor
MTALVEGWTLKVERGPDCLFVHLECAAGAPCDFSNLADQVWALLEQHFVYRLVLELDGLPLLRSQLIGQLVLLHKRLAQHGGMMRICGLSARNQQALRTSRLEPHFPHYRDREDAVLGGRPAQPR